jgi:hypothetical protein
MRPGIRRMENAVESDWEFVIKVDWAPARLDAAVGQGQTANLTPGLFLGNIFPKAVLWGIRPGVGLDNGG